MWLFDKQEGQSIQVWWLKKMIKIILTLGMNSKVGI